MNKRSKKPAVTPDEGPCPEGCKAFKVTVTETYTKVYTIFAKDETEAEEVAGERCSTGKISPTDDKDSEYDNSISAEEAELRVFDLPVHDYVKWRGKKYPCYLLTRGKESVLVSTCELQKMLFREDDFEEYVNESAQMIDEDIAFYCTVEDTVKDVVHSIWE